MTQNTTTTTTTTDTNTDTLRCGLKRPQQVRPWDHLLEHVKNNDLAGLLKAAAETQPDGTEAVNLLQWTNPGTYWLQAPGSVEELAKTMTLWSYDQRTMGSIALEELAEPIEAALWDNVAAGGAAQKFHGDLVAFASDFQRLDECARQIIRSLTELGHLETLAKKGPAGSISYYRQQLGHLGQELTKLMQAFCCSGSLEPAQVTAWVARVGQLERKGPACDTSRYVTRDALKSLCRPALTDVLKLAKGLAAIKQPEVGTLSRRVGILQEIAQDLQEAYGKTWDDLYRVALKQARRAALDQATALADGRQDIQALHDTLARDMRRLADMARWAEEAKEGNAWVAIYSQGVASFETMEAEAPLSSILEAAKA